MREAATTNQTNKIDKANSNHKLDKKDNAYKYIATTRQLRHKSTVFICYRSRYFRKRLTFK